MNNWTYFKAQKWASSFLSQKGKKDIAAPEFILRMMHDWNTMDVLANNQVLMPNDEVMRFRRAIERVANDEPAQYVVGKAPFFGRTFVVNRDVLIPETETEELVEWVLSHHSNDEQLNVLDLGTGSGVIGITLALERPEWNITLSDVSDAALRVASANQRMHGTNLKQVKSDLFNNLNYEQYDLIVTNPPYVSLNATDVMDESVLKYEPEIALFSSENGLGFYHRLFKDISDHVSSNGVLFGETGYDQEQSIQKLFKSLLPEAKIEVKHDIAGRMRMIHAWNF